MCMYLLLQKLVVLERLEIAMFVYQKNTITYLRRTYKTIVKRFTANNNLRRVFFYGKTYFSKLIY